MRTACLAAQLNRRQPCVLGNDVIAGCLAALLSTSYFMSFQCLPELYVSFCFLVMLLGWISDFNSSVCVCVPDVYVYMCVCVCVCG